MESYSLPDLDNDVYWTEVLLADILISHNNFKVLGNKKNAFVPMQNKDNIKSFEDILYEILKSEYHGASNLQKFADELVDAGIIIKGITKSMLGNSEKVSIVSQEIMLTELVSDA